MTNDVWKSEERFRAVVDQSPVPFALNDDKQNITYLNPAFIRVFGYTLEDIPTLDDWWPKAYPDPDYRKWVATTWAARLNKSLRENTAFEPLEINIRCKDGSVRTVIAHASSLGRSDDMNHLVVLFDITERKRAEVELKRRERHLSALYRDVAAILFYVAIEPNDRFRFVSVNNAFFEVTGLSADQVVGKLVQDVLPAASYELVVGKYRQAIHEKATVRWEEMSEYPSGVKYGEVAVTPILDENGVPTHLNGVVHDVTERKSLEGQLRAAIDVRDEFISIASHELRTPLSALHMQLQLLKRLASMPEANKDSRIPMLSVEAFRSAHALSRLLDDLLDVTRIRVGKLKLEKREMDLRAAVTECISFVAEEARQKGSTIVLEAAKPVIGSWDPVRITQILSNLLSNAIKYGEGKPIEVSVHADQSTRKARLLVRDHGLGISLDMQSKIFERFQRAVSGDKITGLGLGLYIARQIVESHQGTIRVESKPGDGALFIVELPSVDIRH